MNPRRAGAALGALVTAGGLVAWLGLPPLDEFVWMILFVVVGCGAIFGGGVVLAWEHLTRRPGVLGRTVAALLVLSLLPAACYQRRASGTAAFLAHADSVKGVVRGRNLFGNLLVFYSPGPGKGARLVAERKAAHDRFRRGDSIWVYLARDASDRVDVWPPGPDLRTSLRRLLWFWGIGGVLIAGYGPLLTGRSPSPPGGQPPSDPDAPVG